MTDLAKAQLPGLPDKRQVAASFSRAAASYDSVAALQRAVADALLARLPVDLRPQRWLDLEHRLSRQHLHQLNLLSMHPMEQ